MLAKNISVLLVNPCDSDAVAGAVETAVESAYKLINGESIEKVIPVEVTLVNKDNVADFME